MATAPFQLWLDLAQISSAVRTSGTVTVTTASPHGITTGAYVQLEGATGTAGTSMSGVHQVTATSGSTFTYTSSGTAGTGVTGSAVISYDLLNPLINYSGTAKESALYVPTESLLFGASGDGSGASSSMSVMQDDTPSDGPWFKLIPDQSRVRLARTSTGGTPAADGSDIYFTSIISGVSAEMNGSGQGVISSVAMQDMTSLLDKVVVYPVGKQKRLIEIGGATRVRGANPGTDNGTATFRTNVGHGLTTGDTVAIENCNVSSAGSSFLEDSTSVTVIDNNTFEVVVNQFVLAGTGNVNITPTSATSAGSAFTVVVPGNTFYQPSIGTVATVVIDGVAGGDAAGRNLLNRVWSNATFVGDNTAGTFTINAGTSLAGTSFNVGSATIRGLATVRQTGAQDGTTITIASNQTEQQVLTTVLGYVDKVKGFDPVFQRVFNTAGTAKLNGSTEFRTREPIEFEPQSLRSTLDTVAEAFQGIDAKPRRYFVDVNGNLNYATADETAPPTYATAPYKIITSGTQNPDTTVAAATVMAFNLQIGYDYHLTKAGIGLANAGTAYGPMISTYRDYGFAERKNAPYFDDLIDEDEATSEYQGNAYRYGKSFFLQAHPPLLSGQFTLRGAGTAAHNQYGYSAGYAQTGASTFALVKRWEPNQYVDISAAELGLSGLYRIEQVDWTLERGSFTQIITVTFSYKPQFTLSNQLAQVR